MKINNLTGIRGIAALWVFGLHYQEYFLGLIPHYGVLNAIFQHGAYGVDLFFCLSGFILGFVYFDTLKSSKVNNIRNVIKDFYIRRLARIYPVYLITTLLASFFYGVAILTGHQFHNESSDNLSGFNFFLNILGLQQWFGQPSLNGPAWSVSAEFAAYLFFPFLVLFLCKRNVSQSKYFSLIAFLLVSTFYEFSIRYNLGWNQNMYRVLTEFTMGLTAFSIVRNWNISVIIAKAGRAFFSLLLFLILIEVRNPTILDSIVPIILLMIIIFNFFHNIPGKGLSRSIFLKLGVWSYSLYLTHRLFQNILSGLSFPIYETNIILKALQIAILVSLPLCTSWLFTRFIEERCRIYLIDKMIIHPKLKSEKLKFPRLFH